MNKIFINAGHTLESKGTGAIGYLSESLETRKVANALAIYLRRVGKNVHHATINKSSNYLKDVCDYVNRIGDKNDLFISIHFNSFNKKARGSEVYTWNAEPNNSINKELSKLGFKDRGIKKGNHLYVIKHTKMKAILVEVCFIDNKEDTELYKKVGVEEIAKAIARGII
jgi:N-acetylmuramoyl-L-alanine amidase